MGLGLLLVTVFVVSALTVYSTLRATPVAKSVPRSKEWVEAMLELDEIDWWMGTTEKMPEFVREKYLTKQRIHYRILQVKPLPVGKFYLSPDEYSGYVDSRVSDCYKVERLSNPYAEYYWMKEPVFRMYDAQFVHYQAVHKFEPVFTEDRVNKIFWGDRWKKEKVDYVQNYKEMFK